MAYTATAIDSAELALATAGKPIICGLNAMHLSGVDARWTPGGTFTTDESDPDFPAFRGHDRLTQYPTKGDTGGTAWYYVVSLPAATEYDFVAFTGHNFGDLTSALATVQIDDGATFPSPVAIMGPVSLDGNKRRILLLTSRYTGDHYLRLRITTGASEIPEIGELWLGRRRQLSRKPNRPYDPSGPHLTMGASFRSQSGVETFYPHSRGQRVVRANLNPDSTADQATLRAAYTDANHGTEPIIWIEQPDTAPEEFLITTMGGSEREFHLPFVGPYEAETDIELFEQGPEEHYLANET